jgi:hypothetical protein
MNSALHLKTEVLEGNKIEIKDDNLVVGETVEIFVILPEKQEKSTRNILQTIETIRNHRSCFKTPEEVDQYLRQERDSWD